MRRIKFNVGPLGVFVSVGTVDYFQMPPVSRLNVTLAWAHRRRP